MKLIKIPPELFSNWIRVRMQEIGIEKVSNLIEATPLSNKILINKATTPGYGDRRGPFLFHRHRGRAQNIVDQLFSESQGKQIYIGEWHTHRHSTPSPSFKDKLEIKRAYKKSKIEPGFCCFNHCR